MGLFQNSVLANFLKNLDKNLIADNFKNFKSYFQNADIQQNIREAKEEQFQEGFLRELFVKILGYTLYPSRDFNLTTEYKNIKDSKKADGAVIINNTVKAVIELKSTANTDLSKIEYQAFGYKNNQPDCTYIIISNFEKLRFYIDNAVEYIEFNLFSLDESEFALLYLCLSYDSIKNNLPKSIQSDSLTCEDVVTKRLYNDYSLFKRELYNNMIELNPQYDPVTLFKISQKLLDRFLFIFFAEDKQLLQPNSIMQILDDWRGLKEIDVVVPLYDRIKKYFGYLDTGFKSKRYDVFAYNGGLFKPDPVLDSLIIDDEILFKHTEKISRYDFESEVDVNILGHIFENSLNELDEIKVALDGKTIEKSKTKRKKDGVFYTPKYITKYIVENTLGKLCTDKKAEIQINEDDYIYDKKRKKENTQALLNKLKTYRNWLLELTVCDPACGSGAFLNQALDYLIAEHKYLDELQAKLLGEGIVFSDIEKSILENNLFGVDINEESVEIAKLSLWLRTAQPNRKLNDLNNNIKCGNSLIDDPAVAGEKAFDWKKEFPVQMSKGGFDIIIGNPPYGVTFSKNEKNYLNNFDSFVPDYEIYFYFISKGLLLLKQNGFLSFICPITFLSNLFAKKYRYNLLDKYSINELVELSQDSTFQDAKVRTCIFKITNNNTENKIKLCTIGNNKEITVNNEYDKKNLKDNIDNWLNLFTSNNEIQIIINKMRKYDSLGTFFYVSQGLIPYDKYRGHSEETIKNRIWHSNCKKDDTYRKELKGGDIKRYNITWNNELWISYGKWLAAPREQKYFIFPRILIREIVDKYLFCCYSDEEYYNTPSIINIISNKDEMINIKYLLNILNSKVIAFYHYNSSPKSKKGLFPKILVNDVRNLPIPNIQPFAQLPFIKLADIMLEKNRELQQIKTNFVEFIREQYKIEKVSTKLQNWMDCSFDDFCKELEKNKIKLSSTQKFDLMPLFNREKAKANEIQAIIASTDKKIDSMVYELYGLTEEEIQIVEGI